MIWNKLAKKYDHLWVQKYSLAPTRKQVMKRIASIDAESLADIGCGTGQLLGEISIRYPEIKLTGIDKASEMIEKCKEKRIAAQFLCHELPCTSLPVSAFDAIVCCHSFPYYKDKPQVIAQAHALLKEKGTAIFVQASQNSIYDKIALWLVEKTAEKAEYLSKIDFVALLENRFTIIERFTIREKWFMPSICGFVMRKI